MRFCSQLTYSRCLVFATGDSQCYQIKHWKLFTIVLNAVHSRIIATIKPSRIKPNLQYTIKVKIIDLNAINIRMIMNYIKNEEFYATNIKTTTTHTNTFIIDVYCFWRGIKLLSVQCIGTFVSSKSQAVAFTRVWIVIACHRF